MMGGKRIFAIIMSKNKTNDLPLREEISDSFKWNLNDIYNSIKEWNADYNCVHKNITKLTTMEETFVDSAENLLEGLNLYSETMEKVEKLFVFSRMQKDQDNSNSDSIALSDKAQGLLVDFNSKTAFIVPKILELDNTTIDEFFSKLDGLHEFEFFIEEILRKKIHSLSKKEEKILAMVGEVSVAPENIFSMINNADMKFPDILDEKGKSIELTHGRYIGFMENSNRRVRKEAFKSLYETYAKQKNTIASTLSFSVKKDIFYSKTRNYESTIHKALYDDNISIDVYNNLIATVENNLDSMYRYIDLRKKALKIDNLHMYDLYVPIVQDINMQIDFPEAKKIIYEALKPLGSDYLEIIDEAFDSGWIDVYENKGKTSGAYSWGCYDTHPYILMNYQNNVNNVYTLAHELGHAVHSYLSNKNQPYILAGYKIFVAEVASTLNEILLTDYFLKTLDDERQKAYILNNYLEQFRGTVFRQTMFAEFEKNIHEMAEQSKPFTVDSLSDLYFKLNKKYYGPNMIIDKEISLEWARIPHFYSSFYVYKYATGFSAATALAENILDNNKSSVNDYITFLSSGGSDYPIELLKKAGIDMTNSKPIEQALKTFLTYVTKLEKILL